MSSVRSKKATLLITSLLTLGLLLGSLAFATEKKVSIEVDGNVLETRVLFSSTVGEVLDQYQIVLSNEDLVEPSRETAITEDMQIKVTRSFAVKVRANGTTKEILTTPVSVLRAVALAGFNWDGNDIIKVTTGKSSKEFILSPGILPALTAADDKPVNRAGPLTGHFQEAELAPALGPIPAYMEPIGPGDIVELIRVTQREFAVDEPLAYQVERKVDSTIELGLSETVQQGKNGLARNIFLITCHNGQEVQREKIKTEVLVQPQNQVIAAGESYSVSRGGQRFNFREARYMESTAYTYTGNRTATGVYPAVGMVAVDPRVISLGTKMYIEGYGYATATDTGGAIKGNKIDVFLETYSQCMNWGRRSVKVYLLP